MNELLSIKYVVELVKEEGQQSSGKQRNALIARHGIHQSHQEYIMQQLFVVRYT